MAVDRPLSQRRLLPGTERGLSPLTLGTNVFGWTIDEAESFRLLDRFVELGGNSIDTADVYSFWGEGNEGGESERIIGAWLRQVGHRDDVAIATKVGAPGGRFGDRPSLAPRVIRDRFEASLERLGCDRVEILYLHQVDPTTPVDDVVALLDELRGMGMVDHVAVSNFPPAALRALHDVAQARGGASRPVAIQSHWSLLADAFEHEVVPTCRELGVGCLPFWGLEKGYLTGKYRSCDHVAVTARQQRHRPYALHDARGARVLDALDRLAADHEAPVAAVALAWLLHQSMTPSVVASARTPEQLAELAALGRVRLSADDLALLAWARERRPQPGGG